MKFIKELHFIRDFLVIYVIQCCLCVVDCHALCSYMYSMFSLSLLLLLLLLLLLFDCITPTKRNSSAPIVVNKSINQLPEDMRQAVSQ